jgi:hypothetical protein
MKPRGFPPAGAPANPPAETPGTCPVDDRELQRFLKPQPPLPIPERTKPQFEPGLLAHTLLGNRIYKGVR